MSDIQAQIIREIPQPSSLKQWITRQPVVAYFVLAYLGTWLLQLPMVLGQDGLGIFSFSVPLPIYIVLFLASSFSRPTGAAIYVTSVLEGRAYGASSAATGNGESAFAGICSPSLPFRSSIC